MRRLIVTFSAVVLWTGNAIAEKQECANPDTAFTHLASGELSSIASTCDDQAMANLWSHRARFAELMNDHAVLAQLQQIQRDKDQWTAQRDQMFVNLVEIFTAVYPLEKEERVEVITAAYDYVIEIAELRLKGYDHQAERLEEKAIQVHGKLDNAADP